MPGTSPSFLGDMLAERHALDRAVDDLGMLRDLTEGHVQAVLGYYGTAARRAAGVDYHDQVERVLKGLTRDMEAVERLREHLSMTERGVRDTVELARVQHLKAELEKLQRKLRKVLLELPGRRRAHFLTARRSPAAEAESAPKRDRPGPRRRRSHRGRLQRRHPRSSPKRPPSSPRRRRLRRRAPKN